MWWAAIVFWALQDHVWTQDNLTAFRPQNCSLDCIRAGEPGCEYCRITKADIRKVLGFTSLTRFGGCIPRPCFLLLGSEDPNICQHYVQAPNDVKIELLDDPNPTFDTAVVSWRPSYYGIAFLRGFQVSLQRLGGLGTACQLFLFHRNLTLQASHAHMVFRSDPFVELSLGAQFAVTVMALPVPERWGSFYHSQIFSTRSCAEKNGLDQCSQDWFPRFTQVTQDGTSATLTFDLAPAHLSISSYILQCYANGMKMQTEITPDFSRNETHHSLQLRELVEAVNYTCQIAANKEDAVRKTFYVYILQGAAQTHSVAPSLALTLPLSLLMLLMASLLLATCIRQRSILQIRNLLVKPGHFLPSVSELEQQDPEEVVSLPVDRPVPPRLLVCYSSNDGRAHVKAVLQLAAFIQQHMAAQVSLDLWDSLNVAQEGRLSWYQQQIQESDFVLIVCSPGLNPRAEVPGLEDLEEKEAEGGVDRAAVELMREEVGRAKARGQDLSKYMVVIFEYSAEADVPTELRLVPNYTLTEDLELLFSHLHGVSLYSPGRYLKVSSISEGAFRQLPAGAALQQAISEAAMETARKRHHQLDAET